MRKHLISTTPAIGVVSFWSIIVLAILACSCQKPKAEADKSPALVKVGKATLTEDYLRANMPGGLNAEDSTQFAQAFIKAWINTQVINEFASKNVDMAEIDEKVAQYRKELIMYEYMRRMYNSHAAMIPEDSIKSYYDSHREEFILSRPLVRGVYVKIADDAEALPKLRELYRSTKEKDIDQLDKTLLNSAIHYDYFRDKWVDWEQIESRIPSDFGTSADEYLKSHTSLDESVGGFTYLLDINDVLHTGQLMPYEFARPLIEERLTYSDRRLYGEQLRKELYDNALSAGKIQILCPLEP